MSLANNALPQWVNTLGETLATVHTMGPQDSGKYIDAHRESLFLALHQEFGALQTYDYVTPLFLASARMLLMELPERGGSFDTHNAILRILYALAKQAETLGHFLRHNVQDTESTPIPLDIYDALDVHLGSGRRPGKAAEIVRDYAVYTHQYHQDDINMPFLVGRMINTDVRRVVFGQREKGKAQEMLAVYTAIAKYPAASATGKIETVNVGKHAAKINVEQLELRELAVRILASDRYVGRSAPILMINDLIKKQNTDFDFFSLPAHPMDNVPVKNS